MTRQTLRSNGRFASIGSVGSFQRIKSNILEPLRILCEYNQLNFFVVIQPSSSSSSSSSPQTHQRYWSSSEQMNNFCGDLINTYATYVDISSTNDETTSMGNDDDVAAMEEDLKIEVEEAIEGDDSFRGNFDSTPRHEGESLEAREEDCVLLPEQVEIDEEDDDYDDDNNIDDEVGHDDNDVVCVTAKREESDNAEVDESGTTSFRTSTTTTTSNVDDYKVVLSHSSQALSRSIKNWQQTGTSKSLRPAAAPFPPAALLPPAAAPQFSISASLKVLPPSSAAAPNPTSHPHSSSSLPHSSSPISSSLSTLSSTLVPSLSATRQRLTPPRLLPSPPPESKTFLDDDLESSESAAASESLAVDLVSQQHLDRAVIWNRHEFEKPLRPSTVQKLFTENLVYTKRRNYHVSDPKYSDLLYKIIKTRNAYCQFYPRRFCRYVLASDEYIAEYNCRYKSCSVQAKVKIQCKTRKVELEFRQPKEHPLKPSQPKPSNPEFPFVTFYSHEVVKKGGDIPQKMVEKEQSLLNAIDPKTLQQTFLSKILDCDDPQDTRYISDQEYISVLEPIIFRVNPYCRFTVTNIPCFVRKNRSKENCAVKLLSTRLGCGVEGCPFRVHVLISVPDGRVDLHFINTRKAKDSEKKDEGEKEPESDVIRVDHSGQLLSDSVINIHSSKSVSNEDESDFVLKLPTFVDYDEPISEQILQEFFEPQYKKAVNQIKKNLSFTDSKHLPIVRPIVAKYNPICTLCSKGSRILRKTKLYKIWFWCNRSECDFAACVSVNGDTGAVRLEFKNKLNTTTTNPPFCFIRHNKADGSSHYLRGPERERYYDRVYCMTTSEIVKKYGFNKGMAQNLKREAKFEILKRAKARNNLNVKRHKFEKVAAEAENDGVGGVGDEHAGLRDMDVDNDRAWVEGKESCAVEGSVDKAAIGVAEEVGIDASNERENSAQNPTDKSSSINEKHSPLLSQSSPIDRGSSFPALSGRLVRPANGTTEGDDDLDDVSILKLETTFPRTSNRIESKITSAPDVVELNFSLNSPSPKRMKFVAPTTSQSGNSATLESRPGKGSSPFKSQNGSFASPSLSQNGSSPSLSQSPSENNFLTLPHKIQHERVGTKDLRETFLAARGNRVLKGGRMALESTAHVEYLSLILARYNDRCQLSCPGGGFYSLQDKIFRVTFECERSDCDVTMTCLVCSVTRSVELLCQKGKESGDVVVTHERTNA